MKRLIAVLLIAAASSSCGKAPSPNEQPAREEIGFVLQKQGQWRIDGNPIELGQTVRGGGKLTRNDPTVYDRLTIAFLDGRPPLQLDCAEAKNCPESVALPEEVSERSTFTSRMIAEIKRHFAREPERYVSTISRAGGINLRDEVVALEEGEIDLGPALAGVARGSYILDLQGAGSSGRTLQLPFNHDGTAACRVRVGELSAGLYKARLLSARDREPLGDSAWLLIARATVHQQAAQAFHSAMAVAERWQLKTEARSAFLHAWLESLGDTYAK